jgi:glucosamine--fructose-6-phosphate aminotransferase (isomerizing)
VGRDRIVVARHGAPLLLGLGEDGNYAASDASALLQVTRRMIYLEDGDVAELRRDGSANSRRWWRCVPADRPVHESTLSADDVELGEYRITCRRKSSSSRRPWPRRWK